VRAHARNRTTGIHGGNLVGPKRLSIGPQLQRERAIRQPEDIMNRVRIAGVLGLIAAMGVSGYGHGLGAQQRLTIGGRRANFGMRALRSGFVPDPAQVNVVSGGNIAAATLGLGAGCTGFVTATPDHIVSWSGGGSLLRFYVRAAGDTTLLVNTGSGQWRCNDDSWGGTNPTVDVANPPAGQYDVWVGSYRSGEQARGTLFITELGSNHP
jgi:hypothetical protein